MQYIQQEVRHIWQCWATLITYDIHIYNEWPFLFYEPHTCFTKKPLEHIDGLVQEKRNSIADALDLRLSCTKLSLTYRYYDVNHLWPPVSYDLQTCYINGSPQNTFVPGVIELAERRRVYIAGDDFKSGQTKMKSVLVDFLVSAGIKPTCIVSYNHLGNNDGKNLSAPQQFRSKEVKSIFYRSYHINSTRYK